MSFKSLLKKKLEATLSEKELELLPRGYQMIGDIVILNLKEELKKREKEIALAVHELVPYAKTICVKTGGIKGEYRKPQIKKVWGNGTETVHYEHGAKFKLDVVKVMWAKGNINERKRIASLVKKGEVIIDMFAGIGYFTILMAMKGPKVVYAIEKNPEAHHYLVENIKINNLDNVKALLGDSKELALKCEKADRIMMGYLPEPKDFLETAFKCLKEKGTIHYEGIKSKEKAYELYETVKIKGNAQGYKCKLLNAQFVKSYGPKRWHIVVDVLCKKISSTHLERKKISAKETIKD